MDPNYFRDLPINVFESAVRSLGEIAARGERFHIQDTTIVGVRLSCCQKIWRRLFGISARERRDNTQLDNHLQVILTRASNLSKTEDDLKAKTESDLKDPDSFFNAIESISLKIGRVCSDTFPQSKHISELNEKTKKEAVVKKLVADEHRLKAENDRLGTNIGKWATNHKSAFEMNTYHRHPNTKLTSEVRDLLYQENTFYRNHKQNILSNPTLRAAQERRLACIILIFIFLAAGDRYTFNEISNQFEKWKSIDSLSSILSLTVCTNIPTALKPLWADRCQANADKINAAKEELKDNFFIYTNPHPTEPTHFRLEHIKRLLNITF